ncbi:hypothetical protein QOZ80_3BG0264540 [Eleusine coracana subsp. coracana]|nr:hypothetical protein QOZ80_3BG0264540 [Eleusine coracana subsp. coracana]
MDRRESSTISPPFTGHRRRPRPDADAEEASSTKRHKSTRDHPHHGDMGALAEAVGAVALVATPSSAAGGPVTDEVEDGEDLDQGVASAEAGRELGADPGDAGAASGARVPPPVQISEDVFADDIFGESPIAVQKFHKEGGFRIEENAHYDNWDDAQGYYKYRIGEVLCGRYEILAGHGKGVFSNVVRAKDLKAGKDDPYEVAIKIICSNPITYKAGKQEISILEKLASANPEDRRHCVRVYSKQLFMALKHLRKCGVLHCDIKPDNVLVNGAANVLKLCDFGSASSAGMNAITPYLVSRFYRAPEIILGLPYDHALDMWSVGCCLYELYTGEVLFPGKTNNDMLRLHMELKGPFPKKMLRKGAFTKQHFDQDLNFHAQESMTKVASKRLISSIKEESENPKLLSNFKNLLEKIFVLDPEKRLKVSEALKHPFISGK